MPQGALTNYGIPTPQQGLRVIAQLKVGDGAKTVGVAQPNRTLVWAINPEGYEEQRPGRVTTVNTITGAYQDNWGRGIGRIVLSGTTGWMRKEEGGMDGFEFMQALRRLHQDYLLLVEQNNPELVELDLLIPPGAFPTLSAAMAAAQEVQQADQTQQQARAVVSDPQSQMGSATTPAVDQQGATAQATQGYTLQDRQFCYARVSSDSLQINRSVSNPLLFQYTWQLTILKDLLETSDVDPAGQFQAQGATGAGAPEDDQTPGVDLSSLPPPPSGTSGSGTSAAAAQAQATDQPTVGLTPGSPQITSGGQPGMVQPPPNPGSIGDLGNPDYGFTPGAPIEPSGQASSYTGDNGVPVTSPDAPSAPLPSLGQYGQNGAVTTTVAYTGDALLQPYRGSSTGPPPESAVKKTDTLMVVSFQPGWSVNDLMDKYPYLKELPPGQLTQLISYINTQLGNPLALTPGAVGMVVIPTKLGVAQAKVLFAAAT